MMLVLGALFIVVGVYLSGVMIETRIWAHVRHGQSLIGGAMAISVVGLAFMGLGAGSLFGSHSRARKALADLDGPAAVPRADAVAVAREQPLPFWVCSDCRVVEPGLSACCLRCGKVVSFAQATDEGERKTAVTCLG